MKKLLITILPLLFASVAFADNGALNERVFLVTDRDYYVAGEPVWISAFNFNADKSNGLSAFSCVAYVELHNANGQVQTTKIALDKGRGCGRMMLPSNLPTGNYSLIAYTAQNLNENDYDFSANAKTLSVFNTFTSARVDNGVAVVDDDEYKYGFVKDSDGFLKLSLPTVISSGKEFEIAIENAGGNSCDFSVSITRENGIYHPEEKNITDVSLTPASGMTYVRTPEYEGEIVRAKVLGADAESAIGKTAYISSPSEKASFYMADIGKDKTVSFYTNNIFGDKDIVLQIDEPADKDAYLELVSPFANPILDAPEKLSICYALKNKLLAMSTAMQISRKFDADTMFELLPVREDPLFSLAAVNYHLDDYKRFPTIEEIVTEFISQLQVRKDAVGQRFISVRLLNSLNENYFGDSRSLLLIDGTPILNPETVFDFNPLLVENVNIYTRPFFIGKGFINGYVDFVTYKKDMGALTFPSNVKIYEFKGVSQPLAYTCRGVAENDNYPDYRHTIYWHPSITLASGQKDVVKCSAPQYEGSFIIKIEGVSEGGAPFAQTLHFNIKR